MCLNTVFTGTIKTRMRQRVWYKVVFKTDSGAYTSLIRGIKREYTLGDTIHQEDFNNVYDYTEEYITTHNGQSYPKGFHCFAKLEDAKHYASRKRKCFIQGSVSVDPVIIKVRPKGKHTFGLQFVPVEHCQENCRYYHYRNLSRQQSIIIKDALCCVCSTLTVLEEVKVLEEVE